MLAVAETASGFRARIWLERLLLILLTEGKVSGPVFCDKEGMVIGSGDMNKGFVTEVVKVKVERPDVVVCEDGVIWEAYNIGRCCWRDS